MTQLVSGAGGHGLYDIDREDPRLAFGDDESYGSSSSRGSRATRSSPATARCWTRARSAASRFGAARRSLRPPARSAPTRATTGRAPGDWDRRYAASIRSPGSKLRSAALMAAAALGLHELRSEGRLGEHAHQALADGAHGYIGTLTLTVGVLAAAAAAHLLVRVTVTWRSAEGAGFVPHRGFRVWPLASVVLLGACLGQELLESAAVTGQAPDLAGLLGHGGWTAIPLAILFGGVVAVAIRGSDAVIAFAGRRRPEADRLAHEHAHRRLPGGHRRPCEPLADSAAGRAPPLPSVAS